MLENRRWFSQGWGSKQRSELVWRFPLGFALATALSELFCFLVVRYRPVCDKHLDQT